MELSLAALAVLVTTPLLFWRSWGVPLGLLAPAPLVRAALAGAAVTVLSGLLVALAVAVLGAAPPAGPRIGAGVGAAAGLFLGFASARRDRRLRAAVLLGQRLMQPERRRAATAALGRLLDRAERENASRPEAQARLLLVLVGPMTLADLWEEAASRLERLPAASLQPATRALRAQALATADLHLGRLEDAEAALASAARPVEDPDTESWLTVTEALLAVIQGGVDRALGLLDAVADAEDPAIRASGRVVRAHAQACRGEEAAAREELRGLVAEAGPLALERVLRPVGPATDLARALLRGADEGPSEAAPQSG